MKTRLYILITAILFVGCVNKNTTGKKEVVLFCASSLTEVISEIALEYEKDYDVQVKLNIASSGTLARQIEHGASPAVFISASKSWMEYLESLDLIKSETEKSIAGNSLVLIAPANSTLGSFIFSAEINLPELFEGRLSIGDPLHVPAGIYAEQVLKKMKCDEQLAQRYLPAKDVRSALMVVELGEVQAGIVYKTDALKSKKVKIITEFPDTLHESVKYYMALVGSQVADEAKNFYNFVDSEKAALIWEKHGFTN